eukprot:COSAG06_NODE_3749_length_4946_cov_30.291521_5_plen_152_part_00
MGIGPFWRFSGRYERPGHGIGDRRVLGHGYMYYPGTGTRLSPMWYRVRRNGAPFRVKFWLTWPISADTSPRETSVSDGQTAQAPAAAGTSTPTGTRTALASVRTPRTARIRAQERDYRLFGRSPSLPQSDHLLCSSGGSCQVHPPKTRTTR